MTNGMLALLAVLTLVPIFVEAQTRSPFDTSPVQIPTVPVPLGAGGSIGPPVPVLPSAGGAPGPMNGAAGTTGAGGTGATGASGNTGASPNSAGSTGTSAPGPGPGRGLVLRA